MCSEQQEGSNHLHPKHSKKILKQNTESLPDNNAVVYWVPIHSTSYTLLIKWGTKKYKSRRGLKI